MHAGRFVCVLVMAFGTVIVSMMTASATEFLNLTEKARLTLSLTSLLNVLSPSSEIDSVCLKSVKRSVLQTYKGDSFHCDVHTLTDANHLCCYVK